MCWKVLNLMLFGLLLMFFQTGFHVIQAHLNLGKKVRMALNFWRPLFLTPGAGDQHHHTQHMLRWGSLSYIPNRSPDCSAEKAKGHQRIPNLTSQISDKMLHGWQVEFLKASRLESTAVGTVSFFFFHLNWWLFEKYYFQLWNGLLQLPSKLNLELGFQMTAYNNGSVPTALTQT